MKKGLYHFVCLLFAAVQTPLSLLMLYGTIAALFTESNDMGQRVGVVIAVLVVGLILAAIDRKLRAIDSGINIFVDLGASMLAAPVRLFLEIATIVKMKDKDAEFGARGKFCRLNGNHALYYAAWNHESGESRVEQQKRNETIKQMGLKAKAEAEAATEQRVRFVDGLKRSDNKQNLLILPVVRHHSHEDYQPFASHTHHGDTCFQMNKIYINGRQINAVAEITPITLSLRPGVYDIKVEVYYKTFADLDWRSDRTHYEGSQAPFNKTHVFEYKGLYVGENAPVRLVLAAQFATKYKKEYYVVNNRPTGEKLWTYLGWDYEFSDAMVMTPNQIASFTSIPYVDARTYKPFDPRVDNMAVIEKIAERY